MTAAPRPGSSSRNGPRSHSWSSITFWAGSPSISAFSKSGNCVVEWLPQMVSFVDGPGPTGLLRELRLRTVLVEPGHREPAVGRHLGGVRARDEAVRVARVADDEDADVLDAAARRWPDPAA